MRIINMIGLRFGTMRWAITIRGLVAMKEDMPASTCRYLGQLDGGVFVTIKLPRLRA